MSSTWERFYAGGTALEQAVVNHFKGATPKDINLALAAFNPDAVPSWTGGTVSRDCAVAGDVVAQSSIEIGSIGLQVRYVFQ